MIKDRVFNVGFTVGDVEDETQFDTPLEKDDDAVIDIINCFLGFIQENKFENVEIKYIEEVKEYEEMKRAVYIKYDTDGEDIVWLPEEMHIPDEVEDDNVADYISDVTGYCVCSFQMIYEKK